MIQSVNVIPGCNLQLNENWEDDQFLIYKLVSMSYPKSTAWPTYSTDFFH